MQITVVGTGYVGLVTGVVLADLGNKVICVDNDPAKVEKLRRAESPIFEPGVEEMLERNFSEERLRIETSISEGIQGSDVIFIAVGTPSNDDGSPNMTYVKAVAEEIGRSLKSYAVIVNKSTVPVGSFHKVGEWIEAAGADRSLFDVVSNPEFLREGSAIFDTVNPDRIVIGAENDKAAKIIEQLYEPLDKPIFVTDPASAEIIKYASNCFLALKISYINAISRICEAAGGDVGDVAKGMGFDQRIGKQFLQAGIGWGGSCFPKDTADRRQLWLRFSPSRQRGTGQRRADRALHGPVRKAGRWVQREINWRPWSGIQT
jgi:UDPglucose 6-dehydrogenase